MGPHPLIRNQFRPVLNFPASCCLRDATFVFSPIAILLIAVLLIAPSASAQSQKPRALSPDEATIREGLVRHTRRLATGIGERNIAHYRSLIAAAAYIEGVLKSDGYSVVPHTFLADGKTVANLEVLIAGRNQAGENVVVGAHYDSAPGTPGANDNGSGVAALLELARLLKSARPSRTVRLVFFANEEPPYFQTDQMGSLVYARELKKQNVSVVAMISLETIGYFSDRKGSQHFPPGLGQGFPDTGSFIAFVTEETSRQLLEKTLNAFRKATNFPAESVAAPTELKGIGWSDQWSFWQAGYQGVMITDTAVFRYPYYHDPQDKPDQLDYIRMAQVVYGVSKAVLSLANEP